MALGSCVFVVIVVVGVDVRAYVDVVVVVLEFAYDMLAFFYVFEISVQATPFLQLWRGISIGGRGICCHRSETSSIVCNKRF